MGYLPRNVDEARRILAVKVEKREMTHSLASTILGNADFKRQWHEAPHREEGYHTRYQLDDHFVGRRMKEIPHYGLEIEIEQNRESAVPATNCCPAIFKAAEDTIGKGIIRIERDGSLKNGVEIIMCPLTEAELRVMYSAFFKFFKALVSMGFVSHNSSTCGLHIHVSKPTPKEVFLIEQTMLGNVNNKSFWHKFSRRKNDTQYSKFEIQRRDRGAGKYCAINKIPDNTLEFRLYRGTLKHASFLAALESVFSMVQHAKLAASAYPGEHRNPENDYRSEDDNDLAQNPWSPTPKVLHKMYVEHVQTHRGYWHLRNYVKEELKDNWQVPKPIIRKRLTPTENALRLAKKKDDFQTKINEWLNELMPHCTGVSIADGATSRSQRKLAVIKVLADKRHNDRRLSLVCTPVTFMTYWKQKYDDGNYLAVIKVKPRAARAVDLIAAWGSQSYLRNPGAIDISEYSNYVANMVWRSV